jgi:putative inorganic carbon (hco3(-)) transporter
MRNPAHLLLVIALAGLAVWAPMPFGSIDPTARLGLQIAIALILLLALVCPRREGSFRVAMAPVAALLAMAAWGLLQAAPLPGSAVRLASPESAELQHQALALLGQPEPASLRLSLAPDMSQRFALWWGALAAAMAAAAFAGRSRLGRRALLFALVGTALFQILYGTRSWTPAASLIWGTTLAPSGGRLRGTLVNPNHLALYLTIVLAVVFAWLWWSLRRAREPMSAERRVALIAPPLLAWLTLFVAIGFTGSRAGLAAALVVTAVQGLLLAAEHRRWAPAPLGVGLGALGLGAIAAVGLHQGLGRWLATSPYELTWDARLVAYEAALRLWQSFPLTGTGLASFRDAFPMVQPAEVSGGWWHAHNDLLELLVTTGLVGVAIVLAGLAALVVRLLGVLRGQNRSEDRAAAIAALGALAGVAVHSAFDCGLTLPANALTLALVCGAAVGAPAMLKPSLKNS